MSSVSAMSNTEGRTLSELPYSMHIKGTCHPDITDCTDTMDKRLPLGAAFIVIRMAKL